MAEYCSDLASESCPEEGLPLSFHITSLRLTNYRNHASLSLDVKPHPVALIGENGAGKTNILEAISLLIPGRGLRGSPLSTLSPEGSSLGWSVWAHIEGSEGSHSVGTGQSPSGTTEGRTVRINGMNTSSVADLSKLCRIIWVTPAMDSLFSGSASERRRFFDRMVQAIDPDHRRRIGNFELAMRQRNSLLEKASFDKFWLDAIEVQMSEQAVSIAAARRETVLLLNKVMSAQGLFSDFPMARLVWEGSLETMLDQKPALYVEDWYRAQLAENRRLDAKAGRTLAGPHRSDLLAFHPVTGRSAASCSTGEQKILLIGLVLGHSHLMAAQNQKHVPLILFDEIAAHLDARRRMNLFSEIRHLGIQAWMTGTDSSIFTPSGAALYRISSGKAERFA